MQIRVKLRNTNTHTLTTMKSVFTGPQLHHSQQMKQKHHFYFHKSLLAQDLTSAVVEISLTCFRGSSIILNHVQSYKCVVQLKS